MDRDGFSHEYPPANWTVEGIADALRDAPETLPLPRYGDSAAWETLRGDDLVGPAVETVLERARSAAGEPVPPLPASLYLEYARTGNRTRYEAVEEKRVRRIGTYAFAECIERDGSYLDDVLDYAWAACEQSTWVLPAHIGDNGPQEVEGLPGVIGDDGRHVALRSVAIARQLAEVDYVLGDQLHPALRQRIRHEVDRRIFTPFEARDDLPWMLPPANNWNAVCNAGVVISALSLLDSPERQARIVAKAARSLEDYLADFDHDGCSAEGVHYWNYGMHHYAMLAATLETRTDGAYSLLSPPIVARIATYPLQVELSPGRFIPFSDTDEDEDIDPFTACWLGRRLDLPGLAARGRRAFDADVAGRILGDTVHELQAVREVPPEWTTPTPEPRMHFTGYDWWLSRADPTDADGVVVAAKGGHNAESHNHNDVGTFVFHVRGESLLADLGRPEYDADFFRFSGPRWEYLTARSLGHNVPLVNGVEQSDGEAYSGTVVDRTDGDTRDSFAVDIAGAYPDEAGLSDLRRTFTLDREGPRLTVRDEASFEDPDNEFVEVLVSYHPLSPTDTGVDAAGDCGNAVVTADPAPDSVDVERLDDAVKGRDVWRARLSYVTEDSLDVELRIPPN